MNILLANIALMAQKSQNMHWNVQGKQFRTFHKLTEKLYQGLVTFVDEVAEKIKMQGKMPYSTFKEYLANSQIKEEPTKTFEAQEIIKIVVDDLNIIQKSVDAVKTSNVIQPLLDEIYLFIDKQRWFFKSSL